MIELIRNIQVFRGEEWRSSEILIANGIIEAVEDKINIVYEGAKITDGRGMKAVPGFIDQHVHVTGGGGEGGFGTQVPPLKITDAVKAGVTTVVGLLGTDGTSRSVENLVAKTYAIRDYGLTAYCLTGNYHYPPPTLTGSVMKDIAFIDPIIGVKTAISDHRSSNMTAEELTRLASDAHVAGMIASKPGIVHLHTGTGKAKLDMLFKIAETTDIPIKTFRPTHLAGKYEDAIRFAQAGGYIDFTCDADDLEARAQLLINALNEAPEGSVTISTDSNGSLPVWNEQNELIGMSAAGISILPQTIKAMVQTFGYPLEKAIKPVTENVAKALNIYPAKGALCSGADGDVVLLDEDLDVDTVYAGGKCILRNKVMEAVPSFEA